MIKFLFYLFLFILIANCYDIGSNIYRANLPNESEKPFLYILALFNYSYFKLIGFIINAFILSILIALVRVSYVAKGNPSQSGK